MFNTYDGTQGKSAGQQFFIGRVTKVILGPNLTDKLTDSYYTCEKDLGAIHYELLHSGKSGAYSDRPIGKPAYPIFGFLRQYPTIGEIVMMFKGPSADYNDDAQNQDLWYFPPYSIWNSAHHNAFPNMAAYVNFINGQITTNNIAPSDMKNFDLPQGSTFKEKYNIKNLRPFEGDIIIQGRWGQSIRFGSTVKPLKSINTWSSNKNSEDGDPITIITNSQKKFTKLEENSPTTVEDINRDGSSIYLTSNQSISIIDIERYQIRSYSLSKSSDPQTQVVIIPETAPISNEFTSAQQQDSKNPNNAV